MTFKCADSYCGAKLHEGEGLSILFFLRGRIKVDKHKGKMSLQYLNLLKKFFWKKGLPIQFTHFVTAKCNLRCTHCFYWEKINSKHSELTLEEIQKISRTMGSFFFLLIGGGEPFYRDDLPEIITSYYENNHIKNVSIPTNGIDTEKIVSLTNRILDMCPELSVSISISLDGTAEVNDEIRNMKGAFKNAIKTFHELSAFKRRNLFIGTQTTVSAQNQKRIKELYRYVKNDLKAQYFSFMLIRGEPKDRAIKNIDIKYYEEINKLIYEEDVIKDKSIFPALLSFNSAKQVLRSRRRKIRSDLIIKTAKENKFSIPCYALQLDAVMYENGDLFPCELLNKKVGNLRDYDYNFKSIWKSQQADEIRNYIRETNCYCTHECNLSTNIFYNPKYFLKLLKKEPI